ncbi:ISLR2 [Branchiostoma lanceolatum]|uniref:ISLR2 protein n=1 Tax=Branchiostoma lanceolatum TaxID=7740 RepID=A0A8K0EFE2_BRALA|nr:ISLR2 [Branchiostoma lanceolatum]
MASRKMASGRSKALDRFYAIQVALFITLTAATIQSTTSSCPEVCTCEPDVYGQDVACIGNNLKTIPEGLPTDTVQLNIRNNDIDILNLDDLNTLSQLEGLDVSSNKIKTIRGTFEDFPKLTQVQLYDNELTTLSRNNFGKAATRMHYVSLFNNPWNCDCNLIWMKTQLDSGNSSLSSQLVKCETPEELRGNYTADIDVGKLVCKQMQGLSKLPIILMSTIIPSAVLFSLLGTAIYCYKRRKQTLTHAQHDTEPVGSPHYEPLVPDGEANSDQIEIRQHSPALVPRQRRMENDDHQQDVNLAVPVMDGGEACAPNTPDIETTPTFSLLGCVPTSTTITLEWRFQYSRQPDSCELFHGKLWSKGIQKDNEGRWTTLINNVKPDAEYSFQVRGIFDGQHGRISETLQMQSLLTDNLQKECEEGCTAKQYLKDFCILGDKTYKDWMESLCKTLEGTWGLTGWLLDRDAEPGTFKLDNLEWQKQNCKKVILVFGESSDKTLYEELNLQNAVTGFLEDTKQGGEKRLIPIKMSSAVKLPPYMSAFEEFSFENNKYFWKRLVTGLTDKHMCVMKDENGEVKTANSV